VGNSVRRVGGAGAYRPARISIRTSTKYVATLIASGYRNLDGEYPLCYPLTVLVGENNAGKSNIIDGLRTVLEPEGGPHARARSLAHTLAAMRTPDG
jgi:predicted ATPase